MTRQLTHAIRLSDGSYLVPSGCCRPGRCVPEGGLRCCRSIRCECAWPSADLRPVTTRSQGPRYTTGVLTLCAAGWLVWFVVAHWLIVTATLICAAGTVIAWRSRRHRSNCSTTVTVTHRH